MTRNTRLAGLVLAVMLTHGAGAADEPRDLVRLEATDEIMGSAFDLVLYGADRARLEAAADAAFAEAHRIDGLLSNYKPGSEWSGVNRDAGSRAVRISPELFDLLSACLEYSRQSDGAFDVTVAPLVKVWGFYKGEGALPRRSDVGRALSRVGYRHVLLDRDARTVRFLRRGVELDPGGIGKGYAVDRMVEVLNRKGIAAALVSASGSSIYGLRTPPSEPRGWRVSIGATGEPGRPLAEVYLNDMSISTSGAQGKVFQAGGRTYSHIIDPRTGYPARGVSSVSVLAPRTIDSEAWTKPYFVNGRRWAAAHGPGDHRVFFCGDGAADGCAWIR